VLRGAILAAVAVELEAGTLTRAFAAWPGVAYNIISRLNLKPCCWKEDKTIIQSDGPNTVNL
jgi:hypothetical protein